MSKGAKAVAVLLLAGGVAFLVERLIVTDKEAIIAAADRAAAALGRGDVAEAVKVLHPSITEPGDPEATRRTLEARLREMPLERLNFLVNDLKVENGVGVMTMDLIIHPADKKQGALFRLRLRLEWIHDGEDWKVRKAEVVS